MSSTACLKLSKQVGLIDCDNFYVAVERVFDPHLHDKAVVVLSSDQGCVVARSDEAKAMGICMGAPYAQIHDLYCTGKIIIRSAQHQLYHRMSQRVMAILSRHVDDYDIYSIDEAFFTIHAYHADLEHSAQAIKEALHLEIGIPISIGIAPNKVLAKLATRLAKLRPQGHFIMHDADVINTILHSTPVDAIWGIGRRSKLHCQRLGLITAMDYAKAPSLLIKKVFTVTGNRIQDELNGHDCISIDQPVDAKSMSSSKMFNRPTNDLDILLQAISHHAHTLACRLRSCGQYTHSVMIFLKPSNHGMSSHHASCPLEYGTSDSIILTTKAKKLLLSCYNQNQSYRKVGMIVTDIQRPQQCQIDLFIHDPAQHDLMQTIDAIDQRFGKGSIYLAAQGQKQPKWLPKHDQRSPNYLSSWDQLPKVNASNKT